MKESINPSDAETGKVCDRSMDTMFADVVALCVASGPFY